MQDKGFSSDCALCFGQQTSCSALNCLLSCMPPNQNSTACVSCNEEKCDPAWRSCTGLSKAGEASASAGATEPAALAAEEEGECRAAPNPADLPPPQSQLSTIPGGVGEITFFYGVIKSWEGNAKAISVIIVLCSGVWPCAFSSLSSSHASLSPPPVTFLSLKS